MGKNLQEWARSLGGRFDKMIETRVRQERNRRLIWFILLWCSGLILVVSVSYGLRSLIKLGM